MYDTTIAAKLLKQLESLAVQRCKRETVSAPLR